MILLLNVKITNVRTSGDFYRRYNAKHYPTNDRVDVFKYCLSSHIVLDPLISKYLFFVEMGEDVAHRREEIENYIKELFPTDKLILNPTRINHVPEWRQFYDDVLAQLDDNIIWLAGNDDHIFLDSSLDIVSRGIDLLKNDNDPFAFFYYSHWPEQMRLANQLNAELVSDGNFVKYQWSSFDSIKVLKKERFRRYWFDPESENYINDVLFKPDMLHHTRSPIYGNTYTPTKEIVRHFDGYGHIGDFSNSVPSLIIPDGFFENNIRIKYLYNDRDSNYTNLNPNASDFYCHSSSGTDYKWCLEDIPLFWRDKITELNYNPNADIEMAIINRNEHLKNTGRIPMNAYYMTFDNRFAPDEWFEAHLLKKIDNKIQ